MKSTYLQLVIDLAIRITDRRTTECRSEQTVAVKFDAALGFIASRDDFIPVEAQMLNVGDSYFR